jgi:hypothetical protein
MIAAQFLKKVLTREKHHLTKISTFSDIIHKIIDIFYICVIFFHK